jgi:hypothetical protein
MANLLRLVFMVVMIVVVALAAAVQHPEWARDLGLDQGKVAELLGDIPLDRGLEERDQAVQRRIHAKESITKNLIDGQLTLFEAAAQFRRVNEENPVLHNDLTFPSDSVEDCFCRQVIQWARVELRSQPCTASEDFVERLEQDLRRHKERNGTVLLPDVVMMP